ncbi:MAG: T9SS type A sorting domain-containing protein [Ferruginibacter sp.]
MQEKFTPQRSSISLPITLLFTILICLFTLGLKAQNFCANETVIFTENFGSGTTATSSPDVTSGLLFSPTGGLNDGFYRIINNTQQRSEWHNSPDHTPASVNGKMLVVNGTDQTFYQKEITNTPGNFIPGSYSASLFLMNVNTPGTCAPDALLPTITFIVEYNTAATGTTGWIQLETVTATSVPQSPNPTWIQLGGVFNLPAVAARIRLTLSDGIVSGCGNDFAIDDIKFATCPSGGPLPVQFLNVTASSKGSGVSVNWSTASEANNKYFDLEKSIDGGDNWKLVNTVYTTGNSNGQRNYNSYDAKPLGGYNYYRIKQVDTDGNFKYSITVRVKINIDRTAITVLANPFVSNIAVDFLTATNSTVYVRLVDITGKQVATQRWAVPKGSSRHSMDNVSNLSKGMYIISVTDENGTVLYNNKLMKQ